MHQPISAPLERCQFCHESLRGGVVTDVNRVGELTLQVAQRP
jgi:hypothetical protein